MIERAQNADFRREPQIILAPPFCWTKFPKKVAKFETKFPKFFSEIRSEIRPKNFVLSWQVEKSSPKISPDFSHRRFQIQIEFQIKFHQKFHKHTSAGLAALILSQIHPFSWRFKHLEGAGKPQKNHGFSQKTARNRHLRSVTFSSALALLKP